MENEQEKELPSFVKKEFEKFLKCGLLEYRKNKGAFLLNGEVSNGSEQFGINGNNEKMVRE